MSEFLLESCADTTSLQLQRLHPCLLQRRTSVLCEILCLSGLKGPQSGYLLLRTQRRTACGAIGCSLIETYD